MNEIKIIYTFKLLIAGFIELLLSTFASWRLIRDVGY